ncbi:uncharacterized protein METZ01_LOCUS304820 [marine metagenome]|uniref:Uncharacterized protein n=1 Tax=marine metagenome TaxID=408172 RepID=A0A382MTB0_9ZZZZ
MDLQDGYAISVEDQIVGISVDQVFR